MAVRHFLKDGTEIDSVEGIVIKQEDFPEIYRIFDDIRERELKKLSENKEVSDKNDSDKNDSDKGRV